MSRGKTDPVAGTRFGRWTFLTVGVCRSGFKSRWTCKCDCGTVREVRPGNLRSGKSTSCGCTKLGNVTHGYTGTRTYRVWKGMWSRTTNPNVREYKSYGGRGISVCDRWQTFENFLADMGEAPPNLSLDRIDNDRGYEPGNCRWATTKQQTSNRRTTVLIEYSGETMTLSAAASLAKVRYDTAYRRLKRGAPIDHPIKGART